MNSKKTASKMISMMSKKSLESSHISNAFVMVTIILASALLTTILMFAAGQKQQEKNRLSHKQHASYYNLTAKQMEQLKNDDRIAYQIQVKTGILSKMDGFDIIPYYASELSDKIQTAELESGKLPESINETAVYAGILEKMDIKPTVGSSVTFNFYDGSTETFIVSGILKGSSTMKQFPVFFSENYANNGSQLKDIPYEVHAKLYGAATMHPEDFQEVVYLIGSDAAIEKEYINPSKAFIKSLSLDTQQIMLYLLASTIILLACILVIYGVFYLSVIGKIHQFGQLRTIGMTKKQIKKFVSHEGIALFLCSAPVGIIIGGIAGYFIIPDGASILNTFLIIILVFIIIYFITMVSVHKPARIAASVSPIEALRYVPQDGMKKTANKKMCRVLTPLGLGIMNFSKNKKKTVITMLSLALGGILFMTAATYMSSFNKENYARQGYFKYAEFNIQYSNTAIELNENGMGGLQVTAPLDDKMVQEISVLDGVKDVQEIKGFGINFDYPENNEYGKSDIIYPLTNDETKDISKYLEKGSCDYEKLMSGDYILAAGNKNAEEIYGWEFTINDNIILHYYDGNKLTEKKVTILGILNDQYILDHSGLEGWFLMPENAIMKLVSYDNLNTNLLVSSKTGKESRIRNILTKMIASKSELTLETLADRRIVYEQTTTQIFSAISGLSIFIMMFSILSMMNTLITNIVTRKQELAMLESTGMSKKQIQKMVLCESLFLVFITIGVTMTTGTICGYVLSHTLYNMGAFYMAFKFPVVFALIYAGVLISVPLLITFITIHSFSKEPLVERLKGADN